MNSDIESYNAALDPRARDVAELLAREIERGLPDAASRIWHRHPVWFLDGNPIVGYSRLKGCVRLLFWSGRSFDEPGLAPSGSFQAAEARYTSPEEIDLADLRRWLEKSRSIQWDYQNIVKRKGRLERRTSFVGLLALALGLQACADPPRSGAHDGGGSPDPAGTPESRSDAPGTPEGALVLDPSARPGDRIGDLVVRENALRRASGVDGWVGEVRFDGTMHLTGEVRPHPADPESDEVCFFPDDASARRLPRLAEDERYSWLCFANAEDARRLLPSGPEGGALTLTIEDFLYAFSYTDVHNVARLVSATPAGIAGCYELELGAWNPPRLPGNEPLQTPPGVFALIDSLGDSGFERGQRIVRPAIPTPGLRRGGSALWQPVGNDSVRIRWTTGYVGVRLEAEVTRRGLEGTATAFTDVVTGEPWPTAPATAARTPC